MCIRDSSPALAGMLIDLIRLAAIAIERKEFGTVYPVNAFYMKMPGPREALATSKMRAYEMLKAWLGYESVDFGGREGLKTA